MTNPKTIRIVIIDRHEGVRLGLSTALAIVEDLEVVGTAATISDAAPLCEEHRPDIVLMDIHLPDADAFGVIDLIRHCFPWIGIVVLTNEQSTDQRRQAEAAGAGSYLLKYVDADQIASAIRAVRRQGRGGADADSGS